MDKLEVKKRLELAKKVALKAGSYALKMRDSGNFSVTTKHKNDFVTDCDKATEKLIVSEIKDIFPEDGFFGEESADETGTGRWIIDPIDGTTNFFRGLPNWCISIAYEIEKYEPLLGVVYVPCLDELYYSMKGEGAYLNDKSIHCSNINDFSKALTVCVPPHRHKEAYDFYLEKMREIGLASSDIRSFGTCAQELCYIASGHLETYYELFLGYYDFAAGWIILEEAGGKLTSASMDSKFTDSCCNIIASNALLHPNMEEIIFGK
ncbi:MAG: inositol monophosphatase [Sphaerochaetaceae bacterium]|nr:inositol monophosphatase [Sphaerochaetaceae bacterium]